MLRCFMSLYLRGKIWWSRLEVKGIAHQFTTKETNKTKAGWIESRRRDELIAGIGISPTLKDFSDRFTKSLPARVSKETRRFYVTHLRPLLAFPALAECRLDRIHPAIIEDFVQHRRKTGKSTLAVATINHNLRTLRRILHLAEEWEVITRAPKIKLLSGENQREYVLSAATIALFEQRRTLMGRLVVILCDTGLRRTEASALTWTAVHLDTTPPSIEVFKGKTKAARRRIPLTTRAARILTEIQESQRLAGVETDFVFSLRTGLTGGREHVSPTWMSHTFRAVCRNLGLPDACVLHSTRHTFCTRLGERGADAFAIQRLAGHSSIVISQRYVHATGPRLDAAIGLLDG